MDLTHEQWEILRPLIPDPPRRVDGRGRPWRDPRNVLNGILCILRTGAPWRDLPERYPPDPVVPLRSADHREDLTAEVLVADRGRLFELQILLDGQRVVRCGRLCHATRVAHADTGPES
jgi:transposase